VAGKKRDKSNLEAARRKVASRFRADMMRDAEHAFSLGPMLDNGVLVVFTKGQMRGIRALVKRLRLVQSVSA
jgi:hypothetical protein